MAMGDLIASPGVTVAQARADLRALPDSSGTSRPQRRLEDVEGTLRRARPEDLDRVDRNGGRPELLALLDGLHDPRGSSDSATPAVANSAALSPQEWQTLRSVLRPVANRRKDRGAHSAN